MSARPCHHFTFWPLGDCSAFGFVVATLAFVTTLAHRDHWIFLLFQCFAIVDRLPLFR